jgi:hypothetical protein
VRHRGQEKDNSQKEDSPSQDEKGCCKEVTEEKGSNEENRCQEESSSEKDRYQKEGSGKKDND